MIRNLAKYVGPISMLKGKQAIVHREKVDSLIVKAQFEDSQLPMEYTTGWGLFAANHFEEVKIGS